MMNSSPVSSRSKRGAMGTAIKKTISLPPDLAEETAEVARAEGTTFSSVVQDALRLAHTRRRTSEFRELQASWSRKAKEKGRLRHQRLRLCARDSWRAR